MNQPSSSQPAQRDGDLRNNEEGSDGRAVTAIFRPNGDEWKDQLERARSERFQSSNSQGISAWDITGKDEEEVEKDGVDLDDDDSTSAPNEDDGKTWRPRRTLRKSVEAA